jgi:GTP-binding protein EngB required for normal cell division
MDLKTYEQVKFELAELIRSAQLIVSEKHKDANQRWEAEQPWRDLLARLAEDRFTVVFAGRFNRGKSSLMNAMLGFDRLPTGIVPLTSVITCVRYGSSERVLLDYYGSHLRGEAPLAQLPEYVTERGNPGNVKGIRAAEIQLPAEILRRGFFFVDTPGLGSAILENSQTARQFIPEIDLLILVTSYESPLTEDEIRFLQQASGSVRAVFIVVNKHDTVGPEARQEILDYVTKAAQNVLGDGSKPFSVSARDGLAARQAKDIEALRVSGIAEFEEELIRFLTRERSQLFLSGMFDRISAQLELLPTPEAERLGAELAKIWRNIQGSAGRPADEGITGPVTRARPQLDSRGVAPCELCRSVMHEVLEFLGQYQYALSTRPEVQEQHAEAGGFCPLHTWHYEQIASPRGVCTAYPRMLTHVAQELRSLASNGAPGKPHPDDSLTRYACPACKVRWQTEDRMIGSLVDKLETNPDLNELTRSALCLPHLQQLLVHLKDPSLREQVLLLEAAVMERTAEDMQRYAIKYDALRRHLVSQEEHDAPLLGLQLLVGHRSVNAVFAVRDIM